MIGFILFLLIVGIIGGFIARALVPGNDAMSFSGTLLLGVIGSFIGGFLGYVLFHHDAGSGAFQASGIVGSIVGSIIALLIYRSTHGRRLTHR